MVTMLPIGPGVSLMIKPYQEELDNKDICLSDGDMQHLANAIFINYKFNDLKDVMDVLYQHLDALYVSKNRNAITNISNKSGSVDIKKGRGQVDSNPDL